MFLAKKNLRDVFFYSEESWDDIYFLQSVNLRKIGLSEDTDPTDSFILIYPQEKKLYKLSVGADNPPGTNAVQLSYS